MSGEVWQERGTERKDSMARVFRGKVAIPGEQMDAYLEALGQFERDKAPLRAQLEQYAGDFARTLAQQYAPKTVRKYTAIIALFLEFICWGSEQCCSARDYLPLCCNPIVSDCAVRNS